MSDASAPPRRWLLLFHQVPAQPAYLRVKIWRRLQALGAIALKNAVYALPESEAALEDFQWLLKEIEAGGGDGAVVAAEALAGLADADIEGQFRAARAADYAALLEVVRAAASDPAPAGDGEAKLARAARRFARIAAIDFFGAEGREAVEAALAEGRAGAKGEGIEMDSDVATPAAELRGKVWVTRRGVQVDRIASAWLIRRFVDGEARFRFVDAREHRPSPGELRFDMFDAEFTHEGDRCTFETLLRRIGRDDPALAAIGEIVHDIDLKDDRYGRPETAGLAAMLGAIGAGAAGDEERIAQGAAVLDALYASFAPARNSTSASARRKGRGR